MLIWLRSTPQTILEKWRVLLAAITFATAAGSLIHWSQAIDLYAGLREQEMTFTALNILFVLDYQRVTWLQGVQLASAVLTVYLLIQLNRLRMEEKEGRALDMAGWEVRLVYWVFRLRGALGGAAVMFGLYYFAMTWCAVASDCSDGLAPFLADQAAGLWPWGEDAPSAD